MKSLSYDLYIDTGGTFTDCIAVDSDGRSYRRKVLSNSTIRGNIKEWTDASTIKIEEFWELEKDILAGYQFKILQENHEDVFVRSYDVENCILFLSAKLPINGCLLSISSIFPRSYLFLHLLEGGY